MKLIDTVMEASKGLNMLEKSIVIATIAHAGEVDKGGNPYILHPLAVASRVETIEEKIVAHLHDVVEDTTITLQNLRDVGFAEEIVDAVDAMTRRDEETYMEFINRAAENDKARNNKIADIQENMDLSRIPKPSEEDYSRASRYIRALSVLEKH